MQIIKNSLIIYNIACLKSERIGLNTVDMAYLPLTKLLSFLLTKLSLDMLSALASMTKLPFSMLSLLLIIHVAMRIFKGKSSNS